MEKRINSMNGSMNKDIKNAGCTPDASEICPLTTELVHTNSVCVGTLVPRVDLDVLFEQVCVVEGIGINNVRYRGKNRGYSKSRGMGTFLELDINDGNRVFKYGVSSDKVTIKGIKDDKNMQHIINIFLENINGYFRQWAQLSEEDIQSLKTSSPHPLLAANMKYREEGKIEDYIRLATHLRTVKMAPAEITIQDISLVNSCYQCSLNFGVILCVLAIAVKKNIPDAIVHYHNALDQDLYILLNAHVERKNIKERKIAAHSICVKRGGTVTIHSPGTEEEVRKVYKKIFATLTVQQLKEAHDIFMGA